MFPVNHRIRGPIFMYDEDETTPPWLQRTGIFLLRIFAPGQPIWKLFILRRNIERFLGVRVFLRRRYESAIQQKEGDSA